MRFSSFSRFLRNLLPARSTTAAQLYLDIRELQRIVAKERGDRESHLAKGVRDDAMFMALRSWISVIETAQTDANEAWLESREIVFRATSRLETAVRELRDDFAAGEQQLKETQDELKKMKRALGEAEGRLERNEQATDGATKTLNVQGQHIHGGLQQLSTVVTEIQSLDGHVKVLMAENVSMEKVISRSPEFREWFERFYLEFENRYRGTRESVSDRQAYYLPYIDRLVGQWSVRPEDMPIVDLGCGRGEWLSLLVSKGFKSACGVDTNREMLNICRGRNLPVAEQDALTFLRAQSEKHYALISAMHVAEHLPFSVLVDFLLQAKRTLRSGGTLILETPNCENMIVATRGFFMDPTHHAPLPPLLLAFLVEYIGFQEVKTVRLHAYPEERRIQSEEPIATEFNGFFFGPQDYGIIATAP